MIRPEAVYLGGNEMFEWASLHPYLFFFMFLFSNLTAFASFTEITKALIKREQNKEP